MTKRTIIAVLPSIILLLITLITGKSVIDSKNIIEDLKSKLDTSNNIPSSIIYDDGKVETIYKDHIIIKEVPKEGSVKINLLKYQQALAALDSLTKLRGGMNVEGYADTLVADNGLSEPNQPVVPPAAINASIDSLKKILMYPQNSGILSIKTWGLTLKPQCGVGFNGQVDGYFGLKWFYWNRLGLILGTTTHQAGIGVTYHVDKWIKPLKNTEAMILYGLPFKKDYGGAYIGLGVNL